jgi:hypothetical protein
MPILYVTAVLYYMVYSPISTIILVLRLYKHRTRLEVYLAASLHYI